MVTKYLIDTHPDLSKEWDYPRNKGIFKSSGEQKTPKNIAQKANRDGSKEFLYIF